VENVLIGMSICFTIIFLGYAYMGVQYKKYECNVIIQRQKLEQDFIAAASPIISQEGLDNLNADIARLVDRLAVLSLGINGNQSFRDIANDSWCSLPTHLQNMVEQAEERLERQLKIDREESLEGAK
jgi:hypothetical protein